MIKKFIQQFLKALTKNIELWIETDIIPMIMKSSAFFKFVFLYDWKAISYFKNDPTGFYKKIDVDLL